MIFKRCAGPGTNDPLHLPMASIGLVRTPSPSPVSVASNFDSPISSGSSDYLAESGRYSQGNARVGREAGKQGIASYSKKTHLQWPVDGLQKIVGGDR